MFKCQSLASQLHNHPSSAALCMAQDSSLNLVRFLSISCYSVLLTLWVVLRQRCCLALKLLTWCCLCLIRIRAHYNRVVCLRLRAMVFCIHISSGVLCDAINACVLIEFFFWGGEYFWIVASHSLNMIYGLVFVSSHTLPPCLCDCVSSFQLIIFLHEYCVVWL